MASKCTFNIPLPPIIIPPIPLKLMPIPKLVISITIPNFFCPLD